MPRERTGRQRTDAERERSEARRAVLDDARRTVESALLKDELAQRQAAAATDATLCDAETRFQAAQVEGDVDVLDALLHEDVTFIGPDGSLGTKADDLRAHRDGVIDVTTSEVTQLLTHVHGSVGIAHVLCRMKGTFLGEPFNNRMAYSRTWVWTDGGWRVVAAHVMVVGPAEV